MQVCKICGEKLAPNERFRGTCEDCETAITKLITQKMGERSYPRKVRLKY